MCLLLLFDPQFNYLLSSLLSQPLHVSKCSLDQRFECSGAEDILWVLEQSVIMLQIEELIARPGKSAWTPVEVEERELGLYLQLLDLVAVQATLSEFGTTICVRCGLEEVE
jgi:hypothetical protein